jgi:hypothetical protein
LHSGIDICAMGRRHTPIIHEHVGCVRWGQLINSRLASIAAATASAMRHRTFVLSKGRPSLGRSALLFIIETEVRFVF